MASPTSSAKTRIKSFAEILDDVAHVGDADLSRAFSTASQPNWWSSLFAKDAEREAANGRKGDREADEIYAGFKPDPLKNDAADEAQIDEAQIAAELDLAAVATLADLARARRAFAMRNHPDLCHPRIRAAANARMQLANMLLDRRRREIEASRKKSG